VSSALPKREDLARRLKPFGQEHLLRFWNELEPAGREQLARQIAAIDLEQIAGLYRQGAAAKDWAALARQAVPAPAMRLGDRRQGGRFDALAARRRGEELLAAGKVGVLVVAGG
jgi:UDP-N-acetylglucosamine/UDP-N-acetylgalactosamine diphosphorylase